MVMLIVLLVLLVRWPRVATAIFLSLLVVVPGGWTATTSGGAVRHTSILVRSNDRGCGRRVRKVVLMVLLLGRGVVLGTLLLLRRLMVLQGVRKGGRRRRRRARRVVVHPGPVRRGHYRRRVRLAAPGTIGMVLLLLLLFGFAATCCRSRRNATARLLRGGVECRSQGVLYAVIHVAQVEKLVTVLGRRLLRLRMIHGTRTSAARWPPSLFRRLFLLTKMTTTTAVRCLLPPTNPPMT
uniref:(northern house mosquito) hypothetical protein n=1 Tax=Culex pipiens TaxID=7175 RepID=A0A8D8GZA0_CULPI